MTTRSMIRGTIAPAILAGIALLLPLAPASAAMHSLNPQPLPPGMRALNPQPLPPGIYSPNHHHLNIRGKRNPSDQGRGF